MPFKQKYIELLKRLNLRVENPRRFLVFVAVSILGTFVIFLLNKYAPWVGPAFLFIALSLVVLLTSGLAGNVVMKSLFWVGADLTLIIYLAQSYCDVSDNLRTANQSLGVLLALGLISVAVKFIYSLYKESSKRIDDFKKINEGKKPLLLVMPFALFTGLFVLMAYQVISPIVLNLCIYK